MHKYIKQVTIAGLLALALVIVPVASKTAHAEGNTSLSAAAIEALQAKMADLLSQLKALEQQIRDARASSTPDGTATSTPGGKGLHLGWCVALFHHLQRGNNDSDSGGEVSKLQAFLNAQASSTLPVTGFFGPMTEKALEHFQEKSGIVATGTPDTTGFGRVGPRTLALLGGNCPPPRDFHMGSSTASSTDGWNKPPKPPKPPHPGDDASSSDDTGDN